MTTVDNPISGVNDTHCLCDPEIHPTLGWGLFILTILKILLLAFDILDFLDVGFVEYLIKLNNWDKEDNMVINRCWDFLKHILLVVLTNLCLAAFIDVEYFLYDIM